MAYIVLMCREKTAHSLVVICLPLKHQHQPME